MSRNLFANAHDFVREIWYATLQQSTPAQLEVTFICTELSTTSEIRDEEEEEEEQEEEEEDDKEGEEAGEEEEEEEEEACTETDSDSEFDTSSNESDGSHDPDDDWLFTEAQLDDIVNGIYPAW